MHVYTSTGASRLACTIPNCIHTMPLTLSSDQPSEKALIGQQFSTWQMSVILLLYNHYTHSDYVVIKTFSYIDSKLLTFIAN